MKTSFWDRVLMFLYVLITLAFCLCMALRAFGIDLIGALFAGLESAAGHFLFLLIALGLTAIVALLSVYMLLMIFQRGKRRPPEPFIGVIAGDGGQVRIALPAIAQMARQAIGKTPGVRDMSVDVTQEDDAISVSIALTLEAGAQVPVVTQNMQRAVRKSLESSCGVAVRDVQITVSAIAQDAADTPKKAKQPLWRRRREEAALPSACLLYTSRCV